MQVKRQVAFNAMVRGLRKQQAISRSDLGCRYRSPDGTKCAIGFLIPDKKYKAWWDNDPPSVILVFRLGASTRYYTGSGIMSQEDKDFLIDAQAILHDQFHSFDYHRWKKAVYKFAHQYNLKVPAL